MDITDTPLIVQVTMDQINGRTIFRLYRDMEFILQGQHYLILSGFETDFMSVPFYARPFIDTARGAKAAILHDYLLRGGMPHKRADAIFKLAMRELGMGAFERTLIYWGVTIGASIKDIFGKHVTG